MDPPAATRATTPGWRDPRLWVGVALVAASVLAGAALVGGADDTTEVWATTGDLAAGATVSSDDLVPRRVRFAEREALDRYLSVDEPPPAGAYVRRGLGAGELLPRDALGEPGVADLQQVPVWAPADAVPPGVTVGSVVDVWATGDEGPATLLLEGVTVIEAPDSVDAFGPAGNRQLVLAVPADDRDGLASTISATVAGGIVVTRRG